MYTLRIRNEIYVMIDARKKKQDKSAQDTHKQHTIDIPF